MNIKQFYICAAIFIALTALRFTSPALAERVSDGISKAINMEQEQTEAVIELGKSLADGDIIETFIDRFEKNIQIEPVSAVNSAEPKPCSDSGTYSDAGADSCTYTRTDGASCGRRIYGSAIGIFGLHRARNGQL